MGENKVRVTEIASLGRRRSRIRTDSGLVFVLYQGEMGRYGIENGAELTEETYREILDTVLGPRARERALYLLRAHDRTEQEIRRQLLDGLYPEETVERTIGFLREYRFVDDSEYGRRYVELYGKSRSRQRIRHDLMQRGLSSQQIEELLAEEEIPEDEQIRSFLEKKGYQEECCPPEERRRLAAALLRRGYSGEAVRHGLKPA